jgi:ribosomal-protein-alanine N-acetyltransferase
MARALSTLRFVPLEQSQVPEILEIEREANSAPWSERSFLNECTNPNAVFLVALLDGVLVAYGGVWLLVDEAHVTTVAVRDSARRQGIARRLVVELLKASKEHGMTCATLEVRAGNEAARGLYESLGFQIAARRKGYYPDNTEDALVMWLHHLDRWEPPR